MSKFKVGDKVRLVADVEGDFTSYGVEVGQTGVVTETLFDDLAGMDVGVELDMWLGLLFRDEELEAVTDGR